MKMRVVEIAGNLMLKNDALAARLRGRFAESGTFVVNMLSSPGSGKTTLLEQTLRRLSSTYRVGALVGDQATANDSQRLARSGAPVLQITTGAECRLDAEMIAKALVGWDATGLDALFLGQPGQPVVIQAVRSPAVLPAVAVKLLGHHASCGLEELTNQDTYLERYAVWPAGRSPGGPAYRAGHSVRARLGSA